MAQQVGKVCNAIFDKDGLKDQVESKVSKRSVWSALSVFLLVLIMAFVTLNVMWAETRSLSADRADAKTREERVIRLEEQAETTQKRLEKLEAQQDKILEYSHDTNMMLRSILPHQ